MGIFSKLLTSIRNFFFGKKSEENPIGSNMDEEAPKTIPKRNTRSANFSRHSGDAVAGSGKKRSSGDHSTGAKKARLQKSDATRSNNSTDVERFETNFAPSSDQCSRSKRNRAQSPVSSSVPSSQSERSDPRASSCNDKRQIKRSPDRERGKSRGSMPSNWDAESSFESSLGVEQSRKQPIRHDLDQNNRSIPSDHPKQLLDQVQLSHQNVSVPIQAGYGTAQQQITQDEIEKTDAKTTNELHPLLPSLSPQESNSREPNHQFRHATNQDHHVIQPERAAETAEETERIAEKSEKRIKVPQPSKILDIGGHFKNDDLKNKNGRMPKNEYIELVRSRARQFEREIEETDTFDFLRFLIVDENLCQFVGFLDATDTRGDEALTRQKIEVIRDIQRMQNELDEKRSD